MTVRKINKTLKNIYAEKSVPLGVRKRLPLICAGDEIIWIPTVQKSDAVGQDGDITIIYTER